MKKLITGGLTLISGLLWTGNYTAQNITGIITETYGVSGNCGMCKKTIETAATIRGVRSAQWSETSKILTLKYDKSKTTASEVLRKVAYAGYDNEKFMAPDKAYERLHGCCQYGRQTKNQTTSTSHAGHQNTPTSKEQDVTHQKESGIQKIYDGYFATKDALVRSDASGASAAAKQMLAAIEEVNMPALAGKEHDAYMKLQNVLKEQVRRISGSDNLEKQRELFSSLSPTTYELMKVIKPSYDVYLDHCPMYNEGSGASWMSKEKPIRNPYYGSKMLTCGSVQETLK